MSDWGDIRDALTNGEWLGDLGLLIYTHAAIQLGLCTYEEPMGPSEQAECESEALEFVDWCEREGLAPDDVLHRRAA